MSKRKTTEQFIAESNAVHNNFYDYTKTTYTSALNKVQIICPVHGAFYQQANAHLQGIGCKHCGTLKAHEKTRGSTDSFILKAISIHGNTYDYSHTLYVDSTKKVEIICKLHGSFYQLPTAHLKGQGCPTCGKHKCRVTQTKTTEEFITKATLIHKNKYDYSESVYTAYKNAVTIKCPIHGYFTQTPQSHLSGQGCPDCAAALSGWSYSLWEKQGACSHYFDSFKVYVIECYNESEHFIKVGKTFSTVGRRFQCKNTLPYHWKLITQVEGDAKTISHLEHSLHAKHHEFSYTPIQSFRGDTECFTYDTLNSILSSITNT